MTTADEDLSVNPAPLAVPCAAHPWTDFVHLDGVCACFYGGPAPAFAAPADHES